MKKFFAILIFVLVASVARAETATIGPWQPEFDLLAQGEYVVALPDPVIRNEECRLYVAAKGWGPELSDASAWVLLEALEAELRASLSPEFYAGALEPIALRVVESDDAEEMDEITIVYVAHIGEGGTQALRTGGVDDEGEYMTLAPVEGQTFSCSPLG